jgi:putative oxidoreductase
MWWMLARALAPHRERSFALLRMIAGAMFAFHGVQKLFGVLADHQPPVGSELWFGGIIELVSGVAIAVGAFTSCAAFIASGTMAVAYIQFHWQLQLGAKLLPAVNHGELALLYCVVFFAIACNGAGPWSLDARRRGHGAGGRR